MKTRFENQCARNSCAGGYIIMECLIYAFLTVLLVGVALAAFYRCVDSSVALRRNGQPDEAAKIEATDVQWLLDIPQDKRTPEEQGAFDVLAEERKRLGEPG